MSNINLLDLEPPLKIRKHSFASCETTPNSNRICLNNSNENRRRLSNINLLQQIEEENQLELTHQKPPDNQMQILQHNQQIDFVQPQVQHQIQINEQHTQKNKKVNVRKEQQIQPLNEMENQKTNKEPLPTPFEIILNKTGEVIYNANTINNEEIIISPILEKEDKTPNNQLLSNTSPNNQVMANMFTKTENTYSLNEEFRGNIVDNKDGFTIKFKKVKNNRSYIYFCERCNQNFSNAGKFVGHFGSHFKMKCYCKKDFNSVSGIRKCCSKNDCANLYKNTLPFNPDIQIDIGYQVPDDYLSNFVHEIPSKQRKPTKDARWTLKDETKVFKGYKYDELEFHHKWVKNLKLDNFKKTTQDKDSVLMFQTEGHYRYNCTPRASCVSSFISRFFKFLYYYKGLKLNEVSYADFFNFEYFEVFFKYYIDTHQPGTIGNNIDNYKIVIRYLNQNIDVSKQYNAEFVGLENRCMILAGIQAARAKTSKYFVVDNKTSSSGNAASLLSTHLEELNLGRMLSEEEMCGIFHYLILNFKNISTLMNIITVQRISEEDLKVNSLYWQSLLMNMQFFTYQLFGLCFFGQRAQITKYLNIDNFVAMENILGYVPTGEKTIRKDTIIPMPNWIIPIYLVQLKIRTLLLKMAPKLYDSDNSEIKNDYRSLFINIEGKPFTIHNFTSAMHCFKYIYSDISVSFSRSYRRGVFTLYVSANFDRFYSLLNIDDSRMMNLLSKAFNTSETIIKKYYIRSNSISRINELTSTIRSSFIGDENQMNFDKYELSSEFCKDANIKEVKYQDNPTTRKYITYDNKNSKFNLLDNGKLIQSIDPYDVITLKIDDNLKIPMFKQPNIPNLAELNKNQTFIGVYKLSDISKISINFNDNETLTSLQRYFNSSDVTPKQILKHKSDNIEYMKTIDMKNCLFLILWSNDTTSWEKNYFFSSSKFKDMYEKYIMKLFKADQLEFKI